ncbi:MAG TPA: NPCBM/NEW2 domain-containing protein [Chthonomonadaceae bacterium]|nr:NPCBM/NEW2 domain-containing protein [Chthonomonadaceae bacterium]
MKRIGVLGLLLIAALLFSRAAQAAPVTLIVAPGGKDAWSGQLPAPNGRGDGPLATLEGARDRLRRLRKRGALKEGATVFVRGGTYLLRRPLVLGPEDSGTPQHPIAYRAWPEETVVLGGGRRITGFKPIGKGLWQASLPDLGGKRWTFRQLFVNGQPQPRARYPKTDDWRQWPLTVKGFPHNDRHDPAKKVLVYYPEGALIKNWPNLPDVEINILASWRWINAVCPLKSVDEKNRVATLATVAAYHINKGDPFRVENVVDAISEPGEWCVNTFARTVTLLPPKGVNMAAAEVIAPVLETLIKVEGTGEGMQLARNLILSGFTFAHARDGVVLTNVEACRVEGCRFLGLGGTGITTEKYAQRCRFRNNEAAECGGSGIALHGYPPGTKDVSKYNEISGNHIHHCGRTQWNAPGISLTSSGENVIRNNYVHHMPYSGIQGGDVSYVYYNMYIKEKARNRFNFRWEEIGDTPLTRETVKKFNHTRYNLIEGNVIHDFMQLLEDGGGIYLGFLGVGNVVRSNVVFGTPDGLKVGIYMDDESDYNRIEDNIVYDVARITINYRPSNLWQNNHLFPRGTQPPLAEQAARTARLIASGLSGQKDAAESPLFDVATRLPLGVPKELPQPPRPKYDAGLKPNPGGAYLTDLPAVSFLSHNGVFRDEKYGANGPLRLGSKLYEKGLVLHPLGALDSDHPDRHDAEIVYDFGTKPYCRFRSLIGIQPAEEGETPMGSATFEVYVRSTPNGEWKRLYDSGVLTWSNDPVTVELDIAGARQLKLRCTDAGDGQFGDVSVWACANVD